MTTVQKTHSPKASELRRGWRLVDAEGRSLGRLASEIAQTLRGKDKPTYTPHMDVGDFVIVVNAAKVRVTGDKLSQKIYYSHSMYPGGLKAVPLEKMLATHPRRVIEFAVWGMLPKNRLGRALLRKLKVYAEDTHPHGAQVADRARPNKVGKPGKPKLSRAQRRAALAAEPEAEVAAEAKPARRRTAKRKAAAEPAVAEAEVTAEPAETTEAQSEAAPEPVEEAKAEAAQEEAVSVEPKPKPKRATRKAAPRTRSRRVQAKAEQEADQGEGAAEAEPASAEGEPSEEVEEKQ